MTAIVRLRSFFGAEKVNGDSSSSLCCDHCRGKLRLPVHRYWRMRFCSAACMNAYQQRLSTHTQQKIYEIDGYRPSWKAATKCAFDESRPSKSKHTGEKFVRRSLTKRVMPDRSKITVTSAIEVKYWIKHLGVTREELER